MTVGAWTVSGRAALLAVALWLAGSAAFFTLGPYEAVRTAAGGSLPEELFGYDHADLRRRFDALGSTGLPGYVWFQVLDAINAAMTAVAATFVLRWALTKPVGSLRPFRRAVWLPLVLVATECTENVLLAALASTHPAADPGMVDAAGAATRFKLVAGAVLALTLVGSVFAKVVRRRRSS